MTLDYRVASVDIRYFSWRIRLGRDRPAFFMTHGR